MTNDWLMDRFGRMHTYLRISVTDRCNLRCTYCMPAEGLDWQPASNQLTPDELGRIAQVFVDAGVTRIRLTGGEPTLRPDIETLIARLSNLPGLHELLMTTNGTTLSEKAVTYKKLGLSGINISLDSLNPERYFAITRRDQHALVMAGIEAALKAQFQTLKINVVVMAGVNEDETLDFVERYKNFPINIRFIEFMPFKSNGWSGDSLVPYRHLKNQIEKTYTLSPIEREPSAVAKDFALAGYPGTVSFITSMTDSFCSTCNRIRLTSDGSIKSCLFFNHEIPIRDFLRAGASDAELLEKIREALLLKPEAHDSPEALAQSDNRSMIQIGG
jgi:cyclic pyranopterin phosphate synthase